MRSLLLALLAGSSALAAVNPDGSFSHRVAIALPPAPGGVQPSLALSYNSNGGDTWLGLGWQLEGLPAITRVPVRGIRYGGFDTYASHEGRLEPLGAEPTIYRALRDNFGRYEALGTCGDGPCSWTLKDRNGWVWHFGETADSRLLHASGGVAQWAISRVVDPRGLSWEVTYYNRGNHLLPRRVTYTLGTGQWVRTVDFVFEARPATDRPTSRALGVAQQLTRRLVRLHVESARVPVRDYVLAYDGNERRRSLLLSVQELGSDGVSALPAQRFTWSPVAPGLQGSSYTGTVDIATRGGRARADWAEGTHRTLTADFDGDGLADILLQGRGPVGGVGGTPTLLWLSHSTTWLTVNADTRWAMQHRAALAGDFTGDGLADVLLVGLTTGDHSYLMVGQGTGGFVETSVYANGLPDAASWALSYSESSYPYTPHTRTPVLGDFDGDGALDIILQGDGASEATVARLGNGTTLNLDRWVWAADAHRVAAGDFTGDGVTDVLLQGPSSNSTHLLVVFQRNGSTDQTDVTGTGGGALWATANRSAVVLDVNGDGRSDVFLKPSAAGTAGRLLLGTGDGFALTAGDYLGMEGLDAIPGDYNGDGRDDVVFYLPGGRHEGYTSNGATLELAMTSSNTQATAHTTLTGDFDGDGRTDLLFVQAGAAELWQGSGLRGQLVTQLFNGTGGTQEVRYQAAAQLPNAIAPFGGTDPGRPDTSPRTLVREVETRDGPRASYVTRWTHENVRLLRQPTLSGARFVPLGFATVRELDVQTGQSIATSYEQAEPFVGQVSNVSRYDANGELTSREENIALENRECHRPILSCIGEREPQGVVIARPRLTRATTYEAGRPLFQRSRTLEYDEWANPAVVHDVVYAPQGAGWRVVRERYELNDYVNQEAPVRVLGLPWQAKLCVDRACRDPLFATRTTYDGAAPGQVGARLLPTMVEEAAGSEWVPTTRTFDTWGNVETETGPDGLATRLTYDSLFHRDRASVVTPGEPDRDFTVDHRYGLPIVERDANGTTATTTLDAHGRPTEKRWVDADGRVLRHKRFSAVLDAVPPAYNFSRVCEVDDATALERCTTTSVDALGRTRRTSAPGAEWGVFVSTLFDTAGRLWKTSEPFAAGATEVAWTVTAYDAAGRVSSVTHPDGTVTETRYNVAAPVRDALVTQTVVDPSGGLKVTHRDIDGHVVRVVEGGGPGLALVSIIDSFYDAAGRLTRVESPGKTTQIDYDAFGRKWRIDDPDVGRTTYTWTSGGLGLSQYGRLYAMRRPDPNGGATPLLTTYTWDSAGRLRREHSADGTDVEYEYDDPAVANAIGKLTRVTHTTGGVTLEARYSYDGLGNRTRVYRAATGPGFAFSSTEAQEHDVFGRLQSLTYPDGAVATYRYHGTSTLLASVELDGAVFARWDNYTARGQVGQLQHGNGVTTTFDYVPETGLVDRVRVTNTTTAEPLYDADYRFNAKGNVESLVDRLAATRSRRFTYDNSSRLIRMDEGACFVPGAPCRVLGYQYDFAGNLTQKEGVAFTLHPGTSRVQSDGTDTFTWSDGGNLLARGAAAYQYDRRNMLREVLEGGHLVQKNHHDQDGRRVVKERVESPLFTTRTYFAGRLYERTERRAGIRLVSGQTTKFVLGPDGAVVASVTRDTAQLSAPGFGSADEHRFRSMMASTRTLSGRRDAAGHLLAASFVDGGAARSVVLALLSVTAVVLGALALSAVWRRRRGWRALVAVPTTVAMLALACGPRQPVPPGPDPTGFESQLPAGTHFFHPDHLGSVALVTQADGDVAARLRYLPYGDLDPTSTETPEATRRFTGQRFDAESGLYYFNARYYDPSLGRFTTADTLVPDSSSVLGFNRYAFSKDNPIRYADPSGHSWASGAWKAVGNYFAGLDAKTALLLGAAVLSVVLAPFTGGASMFILIGVATGLGVGEGIRHNSPAMVAAALISGAAQGFGVPLDLGWSASEGWSIALSVPLLSEGGAGLGAAVSWSQRGGFDAGVSLGVKNVRLTAGYSSKSGAYAGGGLKEGSVSVSATWSSHGAVSFGATYDNGALQLDVGFRSDRGYFLGVSAGRRLDTGVGGLGFDSSLRASFDSSGASLSATASHAQFEGADAASLTGLMLNEANEHLRGEKLALELL